MLVVICFFEQKTAYEMRISDWSSDVCSSDLSVDLGSLRYITSGEMLRVHPTVSADWTVPMAYGATETMTINTSNAADSSTQDKAGSFGVPLPGNLLKIVDVETGAVVPRGQHGEVCIKGPR